MTNLDSKFNREAEGNSFGEAVTLFAVVASTVGVLVDFVPGVTAGIAVSGGWVLLVDTLMGGES